MRTLGIIGGIAPESTQAYYRALIASCRERTGDGHYPSILINSIDMTRMLEHIGAGQLEEVTKYLLEELHRLVRAGAQIALLASNTPHIVFDALASRSPIPLLSIVAAACAKAKVQGLQRVGLFGTRFTMEGTFYPEVFTREGIDLIIPQPDERAFIHQVYMGELVLGVFRAETRERLLAIAQRMQREQGIEALILGGTELPLILTEPEYGGLRMLDTTAIHVACAVAAMQEPETPPQSLDDVRSCIDALDCEIVALLARRGERVRCAAAFKQDIDAVKAPQRVAQVIAKVRALAQDCGAEPRVVEATYRAMIAAFIESELAEQARLRHRSHSPALEEGNP